MLERAPAALRARPLRNAAGKAVDIEVDPLGNLRAVAGGRLVVAPGQTITSAWGNTTHDQTVLVFANAADRDNQWTAPHEGALCYLLDQHRQYQYSGTAWVASGLRAARYKVQRTANGLGAVWIDVGQPANTEWYNGLVPCRQRGECQRVHLPQTDDGDDVRLAGRR